MLILKPFQMSGIKANNTQPTFSSQPRIPSSVTSLISSSSLQRGPSQDQFKRNHPPVRFGAAMPPSEPPGGGGNPWDGHYEDYEDYLDYSTPQYIPFEAEPDTSSSRPEDPQKAARRREQKRVCEANRRRDPQKADKIRQQRRDSDAKRMQDPTKAERKRQLERASYANRMQDPKYAERKRLQDRAYKDRRKNSVGDNGSSGQSSNQQSYKRSVFSPPRETRSLLQQHMASHRSSSSHTASSIAAGMENMSFFSMQPPARQVPYDTPAPPVPRPDSPPGWRYAADGRWKIFKHPNGCYDSQWTAVTGQTPEPQ